MYMHILNIYRLLGYNTSNIFTNYLTQYIKLGLNYCCISVDKLNICLTNGNYNN